MKKLLFSIVLSGLFAATLPTIGYASTAISTTDSEFKAPIQEKKAKILRAFTQKVNGLIAVNPVTSALAKHRNAQKPPPYNNGGIYISAGAVLVIIILLILIL